MDNVEFVQNIFKNHNEEERKKEFTRLWIEIINKTIKLNN